MFLANKIEIRPTNAQIDFLSQSVGHKRFVYNQCLAEWNYAYKHGLKPDLVYMRFFIKCLKEKYVWLLDVSSHILDNALQDLIGAFKKFWKGLTKYPRFKRRGVSDSFQFTSKPKFKVEGRKLRIERLKTLIPMREKLRFDGVHCSATISTRAGKWFASIMIKVSGNPFTSKFPPSESQVGVDLGIKELATLSDGTVFPASQPLKKSMGKLAKLQRKLEKAQKGSNRRMKLRKRIAKLHYRVTCQRSATLHNLTDFLTKNYQRIVIEDLNVSGMVKNHCLARAVSDCGFFEFRRQLELKAKFRGNEIVIADRWFPSSKLCSQCGSKQDMPLSEREYVCSCGLRMDRDINASINLLNYKVGTGASSTIIHTEEITH